MRHAKWRTVERTGLGWSPLTSSPQTPVGDSLWRAGFQLVPGVMDERGVREAHVNGVKFGSMTPPDEDPDTLARLFELVQPLVDRFQDNWERPVVTYADPVALRSAVDLTLPDRRPTSRDSFLGAVSDLLQYSVRTGHPLFLNRLYTGSDAVGQIAELVCAVLNASPDSFTAAPLLSLITEEIVNEVGTRFGYPGGTFDGTFVPGGSYANLQAMVVARNALFPQARTDGVASLSRRPIVFTSEEAHFSILRAAMVLGFGECSVRKIPCGPRGAMCPEELSRSIEKLGHDEIPFMVCATAGTTVRGAFDDLICISTLCQRGRLWLHVDACWGGALVFTKQADLLAGSELADSIAFSPHKVLGLPLQCSMLLTSKRGILRSTLTTRAEYLYHGNGAKYPGQEIHGIEGWLDIGEKSLQCGRRGDVIKFWLYWKRQGVEGICQRVESCISLSEELESLLRSQQEYFTMVSDRWFINVCFWVLPPVDLLCDPAAGSSGPDHLAR